MKGTVERIRRDEKTGSIYDEDGASFSFDQSNLTGIEFDSLLVGTKVEFRASGATAEGQSFAIDVRRMEEQLTAKASDALPQEKATEQEASAVASQVPPEAVEGNEVDESSWESFPAIDAPSAGKFT
jgi:hypothetical protein